MALTGKQRKRLRAMGQAMPDDLRLGKGGLTDGFIANLRAILGRRDVVKLRFGEVEGDDRRAVAEQVAAAADAEVVAVTGRTVLLARTETGAVDGEAERAGHVSDEPAAG
jgi:RNA-binding protein